jgi:hypothetical protein
MRPIYKSALFLTILVLSLNLALLAYAYFAAGSEYVFGGLLFNPLDGNSYLAKIQQGFNGSWRFTLPYECDPGQGAHILLYYLFLGHMAHLFGVSILFSFHFARLVNSIIMIFSLAVFIQKVIPDQTWAQRALWVTGLGSGMGWFVLPAGILTADTWLAEAYPFLSTIANPHFPLGLAIFLVVLTLILEDDRWRNAIAVGILSLLLAIIQPFMVVTALLVVFLLTVDRFFRMKRIQVKCLSFIMAGGLPYLIYQYWIITADPILVQWMAQNQTPAPALWDLLISLSPVLIFALIALIRYAKLDSTHKSILAIWLVTSILLAYIPFTLQRRFLAGVYVAGALLAVLGIMTYASRVRMTMWLFRIALFLSLPGTVLALVISLFGISMHSPALYLTRTEANALSWLKNNTPQGSLVLASPELGGFLPAWSGNCVIYGHPFETIDAEIKKTALVSYLSGERNPRIMEQIQNHSGPVYLFYGPREATYGPKNIYNKALEVFSSDEVTIFRIDSD